ncbi:MAG: phosphatase PAP2 family protein [Bacteroidales bacterium]
MFSAKEPWIPLYFAIILSLFFSFKWEVSDKFPKPKFIVVKKSVTFGLVALLGIALTFALTDILSTQIKHLVERPRPAYDPIIGNMVRMLENKGGHYGFFSSHASNVFGLATLTSLFFKKRWYSFTIFFWAALVSYSRIYVGKHYPLDVLCGALFGILISLGVYFLSKAILKKIKTKSEKSNVLHN